METQALSVISNPDVRHDFVMVFDVTDGNPNGDPDNGGEPRQDPIDMRGIVSPGCIKRRIRDSLSLLFDESLYIASGTALDAPQLAALADAEKANGKNKSDIAKSARQLIFERFIDVRLFGAVLTQITKIGNGGQVTGAIQIDTARSVSPIEIRRDGITRCAGATEKAPEKEGLNQNQGAQFRVPYALYTTMGTYSAALAKAQGNPISAEDLEKFWKALALHLELTPSTMRGRMILRDVLVYTHESKFGSARTEDLQAALAIKTEAEAPRSIEDYKIAIADAPKGVTMTRLRDVFA
ncbi:MAG: type I-C CRISPR-associated protein Cas7/Csd2 [Myxacorys chilensis ATA2-1-KO14]|jgi:CRISPR-associated protein Csd2|nr:type I-C CRISPR-associated protein Cas7/Csd2 [Myxacorys chilensis ATA2-1-KO14]